MSSTIELGLTERGLGGDLDRGPASKIIENAKRCGWRIKESAKLETAPSRHFEKLGVSIIIFERENEEEVAGVIFTTPEAIKKGKKEFAFGREEFLEGIEKNKEKGRKELYPGYQPAFGAEVFAANLKAIIKRRKLKQIEIAEKANVARNYIARIVGGQLKRGPRVNTALRIAEAIGVDIEELVNSRRIDSWLAERLSIFTELKREEIIKVLSYPAKDDLLEILKLVKERREEVSARGEEFHLLEVLSTGQKWTLRSVIEELEAAGHYAAGEESPAPKSA